MDEKKPYTPPTLRRLSPDEVAALALPGAADLPVLDQGPTSASAAHAMAGAIQLQIGANGFEPAPGAALLYAASRAAERPARQSVIQSLVAPYRVDGKAAPPWVADVAREVASAADKHVEPEAAIAVGRLALRWCAEGEPVSRATRVLALLALWPRAGGAAIEQLAAYIAIVRKTRTGRPKKGEGRRPDGSWGAIDCKPKPFVAPETFATWAELDEAAKSRGGRGVGETSPGGREA